MSVPTSEAVHQSRIAPADNKFHVGNGEDGKHLRGELAKLDAVFDTVPLFIGGHAFHSFTVADLKAALSAPSTTVPLDVRTFVEATSAMGFPPDYTYVAEEARRVLALWQSAPVPVAPSRDAVLDEVSDAVHDAIHGAIYAISECERIKAIVKNAIDALRSTSTRTASEEKK